MTVRSCSAAREKARRQLPAEPLAGAARPRRHWLVLRAAVSIAAMALAFAGAGRAEAKEDVARFLKALHDRGYGELAVDYLERSKKDQSLPSELRETWDLEMSRSLRLAVHEAFNAAEAEKRLGESQRYLDKFLKEQPNHPAVADALESWGAILVERGLQQLRLARAQRDVAAKAKTLAAARKSFEDARTQLKKSVEKHHERFKKLVATVRDKERKAHTGRTRIYGFSGEVQEAQLAWLDVRFKTGMTDYYLAQTFADPKDKGRKAALESAATTFDEIFQENRESYIGVRAHTWHGKCADDLGDQQLALDIYDEVLANMPEDRKDRDTDLAPLFAQVELFRLEIIRRKHGERPFMVESEAWLKEHKYWLTTEGYLTIALELAKAHLEAMKTDLPQKDNHKREAIDLLGDVARIPSESQAEAIILKRKFQRGSVSVAQAKTFDEAVAIADNAAEADDWKGAIEGYERGLQLANKGTKKDRLEHAQTRLEHARYRLGAQLYTEDKMQEALAVLEPLVRQSTTGPVAAAAASLAVATALNLYSTAAEKPPALARLTELSKVVEAGWLGKPEADDARLALGQASLVQGKLDEAVKRFEAVDTRSDRYPIALYLAAQTHWRQYAAGKQQFQADEKTATAGRDKAETQLRTSIEAQRKAVEPGKPAPKSLTDAELLLAEILLDKADAKAARVLIDPLIVELKKSKPAALDNTILRTYVAAMKTNIALDDLKQAEEVAELLLAAPDLPAISGVLTSLVKALFDEYKQAQAAAIEADKPEVKQAAEAKSKDIRDALAKLIPRLAPRKANTFAAVLYLAETSSTLGETKIARELYERALPEAQKDARQARSVTRIRAQLVGLLRQQGDYDAALKQAEALIQSNPRALEPKLEKGRILQKQAEKDAKQFEKAAQHWIELRNQLGKMRHKPPEYYEVVYYAAFCLYEESRQKKDDGQAAKAQQLLKATMVLSPKLSGPDMVARYRALIKQIDAKGEAPKSTQAGAASAKS